MTDIINARRERAIDAYEREHRFRGIIQHIVHAAMTKRGVFSHDEVSYRPDDIAQMLEDVSAQVLQAIYEEDAELRAQKEIAERYKKIAEDVLAVSPQPQFIKMTPAISAALAQSEKDR